MYLVILAFDNLNFRQWAVRYKAIRHIFLSLGEDPPFMIANTVYRNVVQQCWLVDLSFNQPKAKVPNNLRRIFPKTKKNMPNGLITNSPLPKI